MSFEFKPPWLLRNRHVQTIVGPILKLQFPSRSFDLLTFNVDEKIFLSGKFWKNDASKRLVILYHGLGGHVDSHYILGAAHDLFNHGFNVLRMSMRGAELEPPYCPSVYHGGLIEDLNQVVLEMSAKGYEVYLVGFSLSANLILRWLGLEKRCIQKAFVVSPPVRLFKGAQNLDLLKNKIYQRYFLRKLKNILKHKAGLWPDQFARFARDECFQSVQGYDECVTTKLFGFLNALEYYESASSYPVLPNIQNKVLIVHAKDDPFLDHHDLQALKCPRNIDVRLYNHGGHMGFYEGKGHFKLWHWPALWFLP